MERMPPKKAPIWECGRCWWLQHGQPGEEIPDHGLRCRWRGTEQDPHILVLVRNVATN